MTTPPRPALLLAIAVALCATSATQAQQSLYHLTVSGDQRQCTYQIVGQEDQTEFVIEPGGVLVVQPVGSVVARAVVASDPSTDLGGAEGTDTYPVTRGQSVAIDIRPALGRETVHDVRIECCAEGTSVRSCERWTRAVPGGDLSGQTDRTSQTPIEGATTVAEGRTVTMGPRMKVGN